MAKLPIGLTVGCALMFATIGWAQASGASNKPVEDSGLESRIWNLLTSANRYQGEGQAILDGNGNIRPVVLRGLITCREEILARYDKTRTSKNFSFEDVETASSISWTYVNTSPNVFELLYRTRFNEKRYMYDLIRKITFAMPHVKPDPDILAALDRFTNENITPTGGLPSEEPAMPYGFYCRVSMYRGKEHDKKVELFEVELPSVIYKIDD